MIVVESVRGLNSCKLKPLRVGRDKNDDKMGKRGE